jgi:large subunit ribosomal protein L9
VLASEGRLREVEHLRRQIAEKVAKELADHRALKDRIEKLGEVEVRAKVGEEGKLFGSVTVAQIAELLRARVEDPAAHPPSRSDRGDHR